VVLLYAYVYVLCDSVGIILSSVVLLYVYDYVYIYVAHDKVGIFHDFYEPSTANLNSIQQYEICKYK
jgi:hypothetical protein